MRSMLAASKRWKWIALAAAIGAVGVGIAAPASADDDRYGESRRWRNHGHYDHAWRGHHRHYARPPVVYARFGCQRDAVHHFDGLAWKLSHGRFA